MLLDVAESVLGGESFGRERLLVSMNLAQAHSSLFQNGECGRVVYLKLLRNCLEPGAGSFIQLRFGFFHKDFESVFASSCGRVSGPRSRKNTTALPSITYKSPSI